MSEERRLRIGDLVRHKRPPKGKDSRCYSKGRVSQLYSTWDARSGEMVSKARICFGAYAPRELKGQCRACYSYDVRQLEVTDANG